MWWSMGKRHVDVRVRCIGLTHWNMSFSCRPSHRFSLYIYAWTLMSLLRKFDFSIAHISGFVWTPLKRFSVFVTHCGHMWRLKRKWYFFLDFERQTSTTSCTWTLALTFVVVFLDQDKNKQHLHNISKYEEVKDDYNQLERYSIYSRNQSVNLQCITTDCVEILYGPSPIRVFYHFKILE